MIELLLSYKADLNAKNRSEVPPLWPAIEGGRLGAVRVLLEKGASIDFTVAENSPVHSAVGRNSLELVELLLRHKAAPDIRNRSGLTPLQSVVVDGRNPELVPLLIKAGADPNSLLPVSAKVRIRDANGMNFDGSVSRFPILIAALVRRDLSQVVALLANGADVDAAVPDGTYQSTALMYAVDSGSQELLDAVLRHRPDLELRTKNESRTALHKAVAGGNLKAMEALLKAGAKVDATDGSGWTPLHIAALNGKLELIDALLQAGANPNIQSPDGALPLSIARRTSGHTVLTEEVRQEISKLLLQHGADESLLRRRTITVVRRGRNFEQVIFRKGTNDFNRHSLYEMMARIYYPNRADKEKMAFPDLRQIAIERVDGKSGTRQMIVNLEARATSGDCTNDLWLEWGDLVEIRETEHPLNATWPGLDGKLATNFSRCLERSVSIVIKGGTNRVELRAKAGFEGQIFGPDGRHLNGFHISHESFRLAEALQRSGLLLTSSDLARVKVARRNAQTGQRREWIVNAVNPNNETDLWLQDGDVIEVPEKDPNSVSSRASSDESAQQPPRSFERRLIRPTDTAVPARSVPPLPKQ